MSYSSSSHGYGYDKHLEHLDQTPLGKLQQQYWTTKQQMIKKLGKKEDEYVVMSDAELDAKLDLFEAIEQSSDDLLKVIEMYQDKLINLSIEEAEMSRFLKSQSTYDTKTKAGKMMAAVSKAQNFSSQQRTALRLPLVRLYNEVETFQNQAIRDTFITIRKMENCRTEYRGALLWMRNVSTELDPDTTKKLEKFRRVQAQVKKTKTKFDKLKNDVIQKIDILSASRCNMFSHVLVNYQQILILFWQKTAKTMNAVADAFKGYQYYEFNIIKDLVEPSKKLAEMVNKQDKSLDENNDTENETKEVDLINIDEQKPNQEVPNSLINIDESSDSNEQKKPLVDEVTELIDLMTLTEASILNEQLKELEQLELEKKQRNNNNNQQSDPFINKDKSPSSIIFNFVQNATRPKQQQQQQDNSGQVPNSTSSDLLNLDNFSSYNNSLKNYQNLLNTTSDEFEREWQSAFSNNSPTNQMNENSTLSPSRTSTDLNDNDFGFFTSATPLNVNNQTSHSDQQNLISLLPSQLMKTTQQHDNSSSDKNQKVKTNWYDLFAELDPLKNPDSIGKNDGLDEQRNC